ncbi:hypothetical protein SRHO_G00283090 [Serrasalmus rhombeus]
MVQSYGRAGTGGGDTPRSARCSKAAASVRTRLSSHRDALRSPHGPRRRHITTQSSLPLFKTAQAEGARRKLPPTASNRVRRLLQGSAPSWSFSHCPGC